MTILNYYREKQSDYTWVQEFQSTAQDKNGKIFNCLNVNFRSLNTYYTQLDAFKDKDGLRRCEWKDFQKSGQNKDKHRIQPLENANFVKMIGDRFYITEKGKAAININNNDTLNEREKWLLMYMLLLDFKFENRDIDIVRSVIDLSTSLEEFRITATKLLSLLKDSIFLKDKNIFFKKDIFWLITFAKDKNFINLYLNSSQEDKNELGEWVINCSKNKKTTDCIAHKFIGGGAYTGSMFNEDVNIIICTLILVTLQDKNYDNFIKLLSKLYNEKIRVKEIENVIKKFDKIYEESYTNSIGKINKLLKVEE